MKLLREFSAEQIDALTDDELIELVANDIASGVDLEEEHVRLAPWAEQAIRALWRDAKTRRQPEPAETGAPQKIDAGLQVSERPFNRRIGGKVQAQPSPPIAPKLEAAPAVKIEEPKAKLASSRWPEAPTAPANATALERLTYPRGLLGHVVQYIHATAQLPDRFMALAGALSALGKCLDRKVLGRTGNSTILYILLIAETGSGKQHIINCIWMILRAAGMEETIVASGIASVAIRRGNS